MSEELEKIYGWASFLLMTGAAISIIYGFVFLHEGNPVGKWPNINWETLGVFIAYIGVSIMYSQKKMQIKKLKGQ